MENILSILGLHSTTFFPSSEHTARLASTYIRGEDGTLRPAPLIPSIPLSFPSNISLCALAFMLSYLSIDSCIDIGKGQSHPGGAGLYTTITDFTTILHALVNQGKSAGRQILTPESVDLLFMDQLASFYTDISQEERKSRLSNRLPCRDLSKDVELGWSFAGVIVYEQLGSGRPEGCISGSGDTNCYWYLVLFLFLSRILLTLFQDTLPVLIFEILISLPPPPPPLLFSS